MNVLGTAAITSLLLTGAAATPTAGGTLYTEDFEDVGPTLDGAGPVNLIDAGWSFAVRTTGAGDGVWQEGPACNGCYYDWPAFTGEHYLSVGTDIVAGAGEAGSAWAVLPDVPGQTTGTPLTFRLRGFPNFMDVIQVRYAPNGGTDTGSSPFDVGDFTELLFEEDLWRVCEFPQGCPMNDEWYLVQVVLPGPGRVALRYHIPERAGGSGSHVAIDLLEIGVEISVPPFPDAGETVHWTLAGSPYVIPEDRTIPTGATVVVDAGVRVGFESDKELLVLGELQAEGLEGAPVVFSAADQTSRIGAGAGGVVTLHHTEIACHVNVAAGDIFGSPAGALLAYDTLFRSPAIVTGSLIGHARALLVLHGCAFEGVKLANTRCQADIRDTTFVDAGQSGTLLRGYLHLDGVSFDNSQLDIGARHGPQPMYVNNISVTNYPHGGGLLLGGAQNFLLGPDNVIEGNLYPIEFGVDVAGILPGSVVPTSGNTHDYVTDGGEDFDPVGSVVWAPLDVPYVVEEWRFLGATRVLPGATVQFKPGAGFGVEFPSDLIALGDPGNPVTFEGFDGGAWDGLAYLFIGSGARLDHCDVRGAEAAVTLVETTVKIDNCLFEGNDVAVTSGGFRSITRGSRFENNGAGIQSPFDADGTTNPNRFVGNGVGVAGTINDSAIGNWWGDPTGPAAPDNPGDGDPIVGPVAYTPFLTAAPDPDHHPPTVRLLESPVPAYVPGEKMIFHWTIRDDDDVVSQRVLFSDFGHYPDRFNVVADGLAPDVRSFEFVIPDVGLDVALAHQAIRVEAVDSHGHVGWDEQTMYISVAGIDGEVEFTSDFEQPFEPGDSLAVTWDFANLDPVLGTVSASLLLDHDSEFVELSGGFIGAGELPALVAMPDVSTDSARIVLTATGGLNRTKSFFSSEFTIRPDSRVGDAPPTIELVAPTGGSFAGGQVVPIAWTASDDEGIHSFIVMASYDGGDVWHHLTRDLPPDQTAWDWRLPDSTGIADVRVRVVARDLRFQNTSATARLSITRFGDLDGDGAVAFGDLIILLATWGPCDPPPTECAADLDGSGDVGFTDLLLLLSSWG